MPARSYALGFLFLIALGLRAAFFFVHGNPLEFPDSVIYHKLAANICAGVGLVQDPQTVAFRPPLYPLFLAGLRVIFGPSLTAAGLAQAALGALTSLVVFRLARQCFDEITAWIAAAIVALYPFFIFYSALLLTETLFTLLLACGMVLLVRTSQSLHIRAAALTGCVFGLAVLTRSSAAGYLIFAGPIWWLATRRTGVRQPALVYGVIILSAVLVLTPWALRNYARTGHLVFTTLQGGHDLYEANSPEATGGPASHLIDWEKATEGKPLTEYERDRFFRDKAGTYIRDHPGRFFSLAITKLGRFWSPIPNYEKYRVSLYNMVSLCAFGPIMILGLVGVILLRRRWQEVVLLLSPVCYYTLLHMIFVGSTRYRTPVMPYVIVMAAYTLKTLVCKSGRFPSGLPCGGAFKAA